MPNQSNLIATARRTGRRTVAGTWWAEPYGDAPSERDTIVVGHYSVAMFTIDPDDRLTPEHPGWGSKSDRCGVTRILRGAGIDCTYAALYVLWR